MRRSQTIVLLVSLILAGSALPALGQTNDPPAPVRHDAALKVIAKNLEALGGESKLRQIRSLIFEGAQGMMIIKPTEKSTYYMQKPHRMKRVGGMDVVLCDGDKMVFDTGSGETPLPAALRADVAFMVPLMCHGFSLLSFEKHFAGAEYLGKKRFGPRAEYVVRLPRAVDGRDLDIHIDCATCLIDRLVFEVPHAQTKLIKCVCRLRDFKPFEGIQFPTTILFEKVGWKEEGNQILLDSIDVNPELPEGIFADAKVDLGPVTIHDDGTLEGRIQTARWGILHSNLSHENMAAIGVGDRGRITITVKDHAVEARYYATFDPGARAMATTHLFCVHPQANYPRLLLLPKPGADMTVELPFKVGDAVIVSKAPAPDYPDGEGAQKEPDAGERHEQDDSSGRSQ